MKHITSQETTKINCFIYTHINFGVKKYVRTYSIEHVDCS